MRIFNKKKRTNCEMLNLNNRRLDGGNPKKKNHFLATSHFKFTFLENIAFCMALQYNEKRKAYDESPNAKIIFGFQKFLPFSFIFGQHPYFSGGHILQVIYYGKLILLILFILNYNRRFFNHKHHQFKIPKLP